MTSPTGELAISSAGRRMPRRQSAADHLPEDVRSGGCRRALGAAAGDAEAGDHLVEDEERAARSQSARRPSRKPSPAGRRPCCPRPAPRGRRDPSPYRATAAASARGRCRAHDRVGRDAGGHARRRRDAERHDARARAREQRVDVAVVVARELDHAIAAGRARASRTALIDASVPDETSRTISTAGTASTISAASSTSRLGRRPERRAAAAPPRTAATRDRVGVAEEERPPEAPSRRTSPVDVLDRTRPRPRARRPARRARRPASPAPAS